MKNLRVVLISAVGAMFLVGGTVSFAHHTKAYHASSNDLVKGVVKDRTGKKVPVYIKRSHLKKLHLRKSNMVRLTAH